MKKIMAMTVVVSLFGSACATTQYVPKQSGLIREMNNGYEKDDQNFKRGLFNKGLVRATEGNENAQKYARRGVRNMGWYFGLFTSGVAAVVSGIAVYDANKTRSSSRNITGNALVWSGIAAMLFSIYPAAQSQAAKADAINKYNDDVLQSIAPQIFEAPKAKTVSQPAEEKSQGKNNSVIDNQKGEGEGMEE